MVVFPSPPRPNRARPNNVQDRPLMLRTLAAALVYVEMWGKGTNLHTWESFAAIVGAAQCRESLLPPSIEHLDSTVGTLKPSS